MLRNGLALFLDQEAAAKERRVSAKRRKAEAKGSKLGRKKRRALEREEELARRFRKLKSELEEGGGERLLAH